MLAMVKDYNEWKEKKAELNSYVGTPPQVRAGDIWWASVGVLRLTVKENYSQDHSSFLK
jgi:hypothetical protein